MGDTLIQAVNDVRKLLRHPLPQSPSFEQVAHELEAEYQLITNRANNTQNAWFTDTATINAVAGTRKYQITDTDGEPISFYKAMTVTTVPADDTTDPEYTLEFAELEHISQEWAWLDQNHGQLFGSSHSAHFIAIYRTMGLDREEVWCEIRPTPTQSETYKILYHQGDWWSKVTEEGSGDYGLPFTEFKAYLYALTARSQLSNSKWAFDDEANEKRRSGIMAELTDRIIRTEPVIAEHLSNLENHDIVEIEDWAESMYL